LVTTDLLSWLPLNIGLTNTNLSSPPRIAQTEEQAVLRIRVVLADFELCEKGTCKRSAQRTRK
jgi:hypothetical protein